MMIKKVNNLPWPRSLSGPVTMFKMVDVQEDDGFEDYDVEDHN